MKKICDEELSCIRASTCSIIQVMTSQDMTQPKAESRPNSADYPILALLSLAPAHGYDVWRYLKEKLGGIWKLGRSNVYALLSQLERDGLVHHQRVEQSNLPPRKVFYLTDEGQRMIDEWMRSPVEHVRDFRLEFPAKLHFARAHSSAVASKLIKDQVAVCLGKREETQAALARSQTEIERQVLEYRIGMINGTVEWLEGLLGRG